MADYKVLLGAELRTKDIDAEVKKYNGKVTIGVNPDGITDGITAALKAYKASPIDVGTTLNTQGLTDGITSYSNKQNRKKIKVGIDPDFTGVDTKIESYEAKPLGVKVELNWTGVVGQIKGFQTEEKVRLNAVLNDKAISESIKSFNTENSATKIKVGVEPDFDEVGTKIANHEVSQKLKIHPKLLVGEIASQISSYQKDHPDQYILLDAKLKDQALNAEIDKYKTQKKVPVDLTLGSTTDFDTKVSQKLGAYQSVPIEIPVRLKPASTGFDSQITKKPVKVEAILAPDAINQAIEGHKPTSKMPVEVRLAQPKDINEQVRKLAKPTETIDVGVKLDEKSVNTEISTFKPTSTLGIQPEVMFEDVEKQISSYIPKTPIKVNLKVEDSDIDEKTGKPSEQNPINVNVKLDREKINEQIRTFKTDTKIKVGVQLDFASHKDKTTKEYIQKGISKQIKEYETKTKVKVGVELDRDSILQEVNQVNIDAPIRLGVELDKDSIVNQVDDIKQQLHGLGNITIHFGSDVVEAAKAVAEAGNSTPEAAKAASQVIHHTEKLISDDAEKSIKKITSKGIGKYFRISKASSDAFNGEMEKLVNQWTNGKGSLVDVKVKTRTFYDEDEKKNVERLHQAQIEYNNELGVTQRKTIAWRQIGIKTVKGQEEAVYGFAEVSNQYSKSIDKTKNKTDSFTKQQKKASTDLTNQINQLHRAANDQNAARPIKDQKHLTELSNKYTEITDAITRMGNASSDTFDDERNNVNRLISEYKSMRSEFKNAENVANKLTGTDYKSGKNIAEQNLAEFKAKAKDYASMSGTLEKLNKSFNNVGDASSLKEFNNELRVAKAELAKVKAEANAAELGRKLSGKVSKLTGGIDDFKNANNEVVNFTAKIDNADVSIESLLNDLSQVKTKADFDAVSDKFDRFKEAAKNAGVALNDTVVKIKTVKDIKNKLQDVGFDGFAQEISRAHADVDNLGVSSRELQSALTRLDAAMDAIETADEANDMKALTAANEEYEESLKRLYSLIKTHERGQRNEFNNEILELDKANAFLKLEGLFEQGSKAANKYGIEVQRLREEISKCANSDDMKKVNKQISILEKDVKNSGLRTQTLASNIKAQFEKYSSYLSVASVLMYAGQALRSMFEQVKLIDSAMTELKKVTNETDESYNKFLSNAASRAKELGTTIDGLVASTADFARLGYGFEDAQGLAEVANIYAVVGDEIESVEDATQSLISTLAAFKDEMNGMDNSEFAMSIVDKMNEVANNYAISSGGLGQALQRSASSMAAANNSLDETIALITAANEIAQNPEKVGNAMKTKFLYNCLSVQKCA